MMEIADNAKISNPDERYVRPKRAYDFMKKAYASGQTVYIYGATGYGKTALAADFLAKKPHEYYSMTDCELSEIQIPGNDQEAEHRERILVLDDMQQLSTYEDVELRYGILKKLADNPNIWLVCISRSPLPAWLKPLHIQNIFVIIDEDSLRLTESEQAAYFEKWKLSLMNETKKRLNALTCGQALALKIAAMRLMELPKDGRTNEERIREEGAAVADAERDFYDYLETHVYDLWDLELQEFLMDISVVEQFDLQMAQFVTKKDHAGILIALAQQTGNFIEEKTAAEQTVYEMRTPMRASMQRRLVRKRSRLHIDELYRSAGNIYEIQKHIPEALVMYEKCHDEEGISRLLIENAKKYAGAGYYWELRKYYFALSEDVIKQSPELMAGMSLLESIVLDDEASEYWYRELVSYINTQTGGAKKSAQIRRMYLDIVLPHRGTEQMVDVLRNVWMFITDRKMLLPEVSLTNNQPSIMHGGKDFCEWSRRDRKLKKSIGKPVEKLLGSFGKGLADLALAESLFEKGADNYEVSDLAQRGRFKAMAGGKPEQVFVGAGIFAQLSALNNHLPDALDTLESFAEGIRDLPRLMEGVDTLRVRLMLYSGWTEDAGEWLKHAPNEETEFCTLERYRYITKVRVYLASGKKVKALGLLQQILSYAKKRQRTYLFIEAEILLAITQFRLGVKTWSDELQKAISQAEDYHFVRVLTKEGAALWELLRAGSFTWRDEAFKRQVKKECGYMAGIYPAYLSEKKADSRLLSDKAVSILRLQAEGLSVEQIADNIGLSKAGVKYYNQETYRKLGVSNKAAAIMEARNRKII